MATDLKQKRADADAWWRARQRQEKMRVPHPLNKPDVGERISYRDKGWAEYWALVRDEPHIAQHQTQLRQVRRSVWMDLVVHFTHVFGEAL